MKKRKIEAEAKAQARKAMAELKTLLTGDPVDRENARFLDYPTWMRTGKVPRRSTFAKRGFVRHRYLSRDSSPDLVSMFKYQFLRDKIIERYGFALPCAEAIRALKDLSPLLEVGAGMGAWAAILAAAGCDIVATDLHAGKHQHSHFDVVRMGGVAAIEANPGRNLLSVWPDQGAKWLTAGLKALRPGLAVAIVHEGSGGCIGDVSTFNYLARNFERVAVVDLPVHPPMKDWLEIWRKRTS
jgi:hypothetical protein